MLDIGELHESRYTGRPANTGVADGAARVTQTIVTGHWRSDPPKWLEKVPSDISGNYAGLEPVSGEVLQPLQVWVHQP